MPIYTYLCRRGKMQNPSAPAFLPKLPLFLRRLPLVQVQRASPLLFPPGRAPCRGVVIDRFTGLLPRVVGDDPPVHCLVFDGSPAAQSWPHATTALAYQLKILRV